MAYEVLCAKDGEDGLARYDEHREQIRLVLLDLTMPILNGEATLRALRDRDPALPIIVMSGYSDSALPNAGVRFLAKPFRLVELMTCVGEALRDT
jgi:CheY-like chemotaxis protein